jgi:hypothetical protein
MSRKRAVRRLERSVKALAEPAALPPASPPGDEPGELARELARAFIGELEQYRRAGGPESERPDPAQPPPAWLVEALLEKPPEDVTFADLERIARADPARAAARWEEVKAAARRDLASGWRAARALEVQGGSAWARAGFLALRERLYRAWPPRHEGEALLLDAMAQYEALRQQWLGVLALHSGEPAAWPGRRLRGAVEEPRRLSAAEATHEALRTVERLQRLFEAALRTLLSPRRARRPLSARGPGPVRQLAAASGRLVRIYQGHEDWVYAVDGPPPTGQAASGASDGQVRVWDTATGECVCQVPAAPR